MAVAAADDLAVDTVSAAMEGGSPWTVEVDAQAPAEPVVQRITRVFVGMWGSRDLAWRLFQRNLAANYRQSLLGWLWVFLPPLANAGVWVLLNWSGTLRISELSPLGYAAFVFIGTMLWQAFLDGLMSPMNTLQANRSAVTKLQFQREVLITVGLLESGFDLLARAVVAAGFLLLAGMGSVWGLLILVVLWAPLLILLGTGMGLWLAPFGLLYKDVGRSIVMISPLWMLLTPVIYALPAGAAGSVMTWVNPPAALIHVARTAATLGPAMQEPQAAAELATGQHRLNGEHRAETQTGEPPSPAIAGESHPVDSDSQDAVAPAGGPRALGPAVFWAGFGLLAFVLGAVWLELSGPIVIERLGN